MTIVLMKKVRLVVAVNDLDFRIKDVFEVRVSYKSDTFNWIMKKLMEDLLNI